MNFPRSQILMKERRVGSVTVAICLGVGLLSMAIAGCGTGSSPTGQSKVNRTVTSTSTTRAFNEELHPRLSWRQQLRHQRRILVLRRCLGVVPGERFQPGQPIASVDTLVLLAAPLISEVCPAGDHLGEAGRRGHS